MKHLILLIVIVSCSNWGRGSPYDPHDCVWGQTGEDCFRAYRLITRVNLILDII